MLVKVFHTPPPRRKVPSPSLGVNFRLGNSYFYPVALAQPYLPLAPGPSDHEISRPRPHSPGAPSPEHEAYLKALNYAIDAGLEGKAVGCYVKRMTYGEYLVATGPDASEEVLGRDIWVVAVAGTSRIVDSEWGTCHVTNEHSTTWPSLW